MYPLNDGQKLAVADYTKAFEASIHTVAVEAMKNLAPAELAWETGRADFAVNRRTNPEPNVPALRREGRTERPGRS